MSAAQEIVRELIGAGYSRAYIGRQLGRSGRLVGQIASGERGEGYGAHHERALAELRDKLDQARAAGEPRPVSVDVTAPARRTTRSGAPARVRKTMTHGGARWGVSDAKRQATASGARRMAPQLAYVAEQGRRASLTVTVAPGVVIAKSGKRPRAHGAGDQSVDVDVPDVDELLELVDAHDGNVTAAVAEYVGMTDRVEALDAGDIRGLELRSWTE